MSLPLSIPSPPLEWQQIPTGRWLNDLGLTFVNPDQGIRYYAICILIGILAAVFMTRARLKSRGADPGVVFDIGLFAVLLGIVGARAYHVLTHPDDYFFPGADLWDVIKVWEGGIAIFGALIGGAIGVYIGCRLTGVRFWSFADALVPGLLLAQALGRLGNWFNNELFGLPTDLPWGLQISSDNPAFPAGLADGTLFHPTFLYEIIWNVIGVAALLLAERRFTRGHREIAGARIPALMPVSYRLQWGRLTGLYLVWYGTGRMFFESIRIDPSELLLGTRVNIWGAFGAVVLGFLIIIVQGRRHPGREPSVYQPGREWSGDAAVDSPDTYPDEDPRADGDTADTPDTTRSGAAVPASASASDTASTRAATSSASSRA